MKSIIALFAVLFLLGCTNKKQSDNSSESTVNFQYRSFEFDTIEENEGTLKIPNFQGNTSLNLRITPFNDAYVAVILADQNENHINTFTDSVGVDELILSNTEIHIGDLDGNGYNDIKISYPLNVTNVRMIYIYQYENQTFSRISFEKNPMVGSEKPEEIDIDGDGKLEIVVSNLQHKGDEMFWVENLYEYTPAGLFLANNKGDYPKVLDFETFEAVDIPFEAAWAKNYPDRYAAAFTLKDYARPFSKKELPKVESSDLDKRLPINMYIHPNINQHIFLYDAPTKSAKKVATVDETNNYLIGLNVTKDAQGELWYQCYLPSEDVVGWSNQVDIFFIEDEDLNFRKQLYGAILQLGASPEEAYRKWGTPKLEYVDIRPSYDEYIPMKRQSIDFGNVSIAYSNGKVISFSIEGKGQRFNNLELYKHGKADVLKAFNIPESEVMLYEDEVMKTMSIEIDMFSLTFELDKNDKIIRVSFSEIASEEN